MSSSQSSETDVEPSRCRPQWPSARELFTNKVFICLERNRSGDRPAVDEYGWRRAHAEFCDFANAGRDYAPDSAGLQALVERPVVQSELSRMFLQVFGREGILVAKQDIVKFPEPALFTGAVSGFSRCRRRPVHGQRKILPDERHLSLIFVEYLFQHRRRALAVRTLEIGKFDDRDRSRSRPAPWIRIVDCHHLSPGLASTPDIHGRRALQQLHISPASVRILLLLQVLLDQRRRDVERDPLRSGG